MSLRQIKKAVVTGPTGAIGIALCNELASNGIEVVAVCREGSARADALPDHPMITKVFCDISRLESLKELVGCADAFFHLAWAHTIGDGRNDMGAQISNMQYTIDAVRVAKALCCSVFVGTGSQAEFGRVDGVITPDTPCFPENGYGIAKYSAGRMAKIECEKLGLDFEWVRIFSVYGPHDGPLTMVSSVITKLLKGEKPSLTAGIQLWDYLYSGDAARALMLVAQKGVHGKTYLIANGQSDKLCEYIYIIRDSIDKNLALGIGEIPYPDGKIINLQADISELCEDTGFKPLTDFKSGIEKTIEYIRETL